RVQSSELPADLGVRQRRHDRSGSWNETESRHNIAESRHKIVESRHKITESRHKTKYLALKPENRATRTVVWTQKPRIAPQDWIAPRESPAARLSASPRSLREES
ncbi:MAG: hypothetical protein ACJ8J0_03265, partial [Longimicrobiaceae bacterium]